MSNFQIDNDFEQISRLSKAGSAIQGFNTIRGIPNIVINIAKNFETIKVHYNCYFINFYDTSN